MTHDVRSHKSASRTRRTWERGRVSVDKRKSFVHIVHILTEDFVHGEHVNFVLFEYSSHALITADHSFIFRIL